MNTLSGNTWWMLFNISLAIIPVILVAIWKKNPPIIIYYPILLPWFLFLPNTIYMVTDLQYLPMQLMKTGMSEQALLIIQYIILTGLGIIMYLFALEPFEYFVKKFKLKSFNKNMVYVIFHFIVAFGVILGKTQRVHSWYIFTDFQRVESGIRTVIQSPYLITWVIIFGIVTNALFFTFKNYFPPLKNKRRKKSA